MYNVLLLRAPAETSPDPYESTLWKDSYNPYSIPALETSFINLVNLGTLISSGPQGYTGVIITSKRSCDAWTMATRNCLSSLSPNDDAAWSKLHASLEKWTRVPFYAVGKGTAAVLETFRSLCPGLSKLDVRGEATGTGEQLARFILQDVNTRDKNPRNTLLYLTGDKNRDTITKILCSGEESNASMKLDTLQVYKTHGATSFEDDLRELMSRASGGNWWIVFFAPSSSKFAYPLLQKYYRFTQNSSLDEEETSLLPFARVAAIGCVTSTYLEEELKLRVDAIAQKPTPEALSEAMSAMS